VNIRFVSTLTPEDENQIAPALLKSVSAILDLLPISYMLRVDTVDGQSYQQTNPMPANAANSEPLGPALPRLNYES